MPTPIIASDVAITTASMSIEGDQWWMGFAGLSMSYPSNASLTLPSESDIVCAGQRMNHEG